MRYGQHARELYIVLIWHIEITAMQYNDNMIIEIDAQVEMLIKEINDAPNGQQVDVIDSFQKMLIDQLMGPFGLTRAMFEDRDGGAITSLHNFEKGVVANDADAERHQKWQAAQKENFSNTRGDYDAALDAAHDDMSSPDGKFYDGYKVNQELPEGPRVAARDHVVSASEIERSSRGQFAQTREERVDTATLDDNVVLTSFNMNSSKGETDLMEWAARPSTKDPSKTNAEYYELDEKALVENYKQAKKAVDGTQKKAVFDKQMGEFLVEGSKAAGKLAIRQILGLLLKDLIEGLIQDVRYLVHEGFDAAKGLLQLAEERIKATYERIRLKWAEYLKEGISAGISGFLSSLITLVINSFVTTAKNVVRMIREAVLSVVRAVKVILSPPTGMTGGDVALEVVKLLSATVAVCVGIALEEVIQKALEAVPVLLPFAATMAPVIAGIITGALTLFTVLAFDRLKGSIEFRNKQMADVYRGQTIGLLKIKQTVFLIEGAFSYMTVSTQAMRVQFENDWQEVQDAKTVTQKRIDSYRDSVAGLDDILEQF